jgi:hypothetical protein
MKESNMKKRILGPYIIGSALIWGLTLICVALMPGDAADKAGIMVVLNGGAASHLIVIWCPLAVTLKKLRDQESEEQATGDLGA